MASRGQSGSPPDKKICRIHELLFSLKQVRDSIPKTDHGSNDHNRTTLQQSDPGIRNQTSKLKNELDYTISSLEELDAFEDRFKDFTDLLDRLCTTLPPPGGALSAKLRAINKIVFELKLQIPLPHTLSSKDAHQYTRGDKYEEADQLPDLHFQARFLESASFKDFRVLYETLDLRTKLCLLCFAAITENEIVRKSFMIKWWISEGFLSQEEADAEGKYEEANRIFEELVKKDFIEPVNEKNRFVVNRYRMNPFIRSAVIVLAKEASFFDFHEKGYPTAICTSSYRACIFDGFYPELLKKICDLKKIDQLVKRLSNGSSGRGCKLVKGFFNRACIVNRLGKRPFKDSGKRDSALVQMLRKIEIKSELVDKLLKEVINEWEKIISMGLEKRKSALIKRLEKKNIGPQLVEKLQNIEKESRLGKRLLEIDFELFKILPKDSGKKGSELVKSLEEIEMDDELRELIQKTNLGVRISEEKGKHSALVRRLREIKIEDSTMVKRLLKMKIGAQLVKKLLEMETHGELATGFFKELASRFSNFEGISKLKKLYCEELINDPLMVLGEGVSVYSTELNEIGAQLVSGSSKELGEIGTKSVIVSPKELGEIGAELCCRFSKVLRKKRFQSFKVFSESSQKLYNVLRRELSYELRKVCAGFVYGSSERLEKRGARLDNKPFKEFDPEKVQIILNVNEPYPDFFDPEWFSKLKTIKILYLGRWQTSDEHHIEMENIKFLERLESMNLLKFFSLQGISRITKLPDSICKLLNLRFLDLRACHNLQELPNGVGSLKELTHLDISECYLLNYMPKGITSLSKLQVFKGFVINSNSNAESCTLEDLLELEQLRKLGIYTDMHEFPMDNDVTNFHNFKELQKLTITWGLAAQTGEDAKDQKNKEKEKTSGEIHIEKLQKLDMKCYPKKEAPNWLLPERLPKLEKLYIRGGKLQSLGPVQNDPKWKVRVLRLKFLNDFKMDWTELRTSFPELAYLEKFCCSGLTFFPSNEKGVWLKECTVIEGFPQRVI